VSACGILFVGGSFILGQSLLILLPRDVLLAARPKFNLRSVRGDASSAHVRCPAVGINEERRAIATHCSFWAHLAHVFWLSKRAVRQKCARILDVKSLK
jgi:hypothetical protein